MIRGIHVLAGPLMLKDMIGRTVTVGSGISGANRKMVIMSRRASGLLGVND